MNDKEAVIREIREAFGNNEYPGDNIFKAASKAVNPTKRSSPLRAGRTGKTSTRNCSMPIPVHSTFSLKQA